MNFSDLKTLYKQNYNEYNRLLNHFKNDNSYNFQGEIKGLLHQLVCVQDEVINYRLKKILSEEHPYIPQIKLNKLGANSHLFAMPTPQMISHFLKQRKNLLDMIQTLNEQQWHRKGLHEREGHVSFGEFIHRMVKKDEAVLKRLNELFQRSAAGHLHR